MPSLSHPLQFLLVALASWINQQQRDVIDYLQEENRVLREQLGARCLSFCDDQRRRLAAKARTLGRRLLREIGTIVTPDTLLAWHRTLIANRLPPRSPNLNAFSERFVRTIKESCQDRMILVGEGSLRRAVGEFVAHYHHERNHQGLDNQLIVPRAAPTIGDGRILSRERLGGLLKYYHRPAA